MEYFVILISALFHAIWNSIIKESGDKLLAFTAIRAVGLLFGIFVVFFLPPLRMEAIPYLTVASFIHFLYFWLLLNTYRVGDFSQVYPISRGCAPLIVLILGALFAGEYLSPFQIVGTVMISLGILSLSFSKGKLAVIPLGYAIATAVSVAGYTVVSGIGVRIANSFLIYAGWLEVISGCAVVLFTVIRRKREALIYARAYWKQGIFAGLLSVSGFTAALWAMKTAPLAPIAALRETSIIFAAVIGVFMLKEGYAKYRILAACIVVIGIAILANNA
ncbi:EamA family transporter [Thermodesulfobacteriota bacterium]